jgi:hypothetical protein
VQAYDDSHWSSVVPDAADRRFCSEQQTNALQAAAETNDSKEQVGMSFYKTKLQAVIWELRGARAAGSLWYVHNGSALESGAKT